jgi:DNA/RNA endonuclease YhcR with UshA esterase domain
MKTAPQVRKHKFHLRPPLVGTILLTIVALAAGLAIGSYTTYAPPVPPVTVTNVVHEPPVTITVSVTVTSVSGTTSTTSTTSPRPKWISSSTNVVSYLQAASYIGQSKTVEGTIVRTYASSKGTVFLDFHDPYQGYFEVTIFASDVKNFPFSPVSFYLNKEVRVTGTIEMYQGAPEIIAHSPSQIEVTYMGFNYP